jgi:serpin B
LAAAGVLALAAVAGCGDAPGVRSDAGSSSAPGSDLAESAGAEVVDALVAGTTDLAFDLVRVLARDQPDGNVLLGPSSISEGLALAYLGARGETAVEMAGVLGYDRPGARAVHAALRGLRETLEDRGHDQVEVQVANGLFGQRGLDFLDAFLADQSRFYEAPLETVDFAAAPDKARRRINDWTSRETSGLVKELFPEGTIDRQTVLALVNAAYLEADWHFPFNPKLTRPRPFGRLDGSAVDVPTMHFNEYLPSGRGPGWEAVRIPYAGEELSMLIIVPTDLPAFEANLDAGVLGQVRASIRDGGIHLALPAFELRYHTSLIGPLRALGLELPFTDAADFSGMTGHPGLSIGAVEHETYVKVDETGTEAAAATGSAMQSSHGPTINVNRPFLFLVQDDATGAILFLGRITDPLA